MRTGLTGTFFNILNVMVGTGIVVLPNMMLQTGKPLGVFIFVLDAFLATVAIYVIQTVSVELNVKSFADMAATYFGEKHAKYIVNTLLILALFGPIISYFIILGDIAMTTFPSFNLFLVKVIAVLLSAAVTFYFCLQRSLA